MPTLPLRAKDVFLQALDVPPAEREAFVAEACGTDAQLRDEVQSLLAYHEESTAGSGTATAPLTDGVASRFAAGQVFAGRYRMIARIGKGGMGEVWHADDLVLRTPVALKFIRSAREGAVAAILNEVRLARKITHPSVCRVFDVGQADGEVFFSMELVRGEDLASLIKRVGRLPSEKVIDIARQLCGGLAGAHAEGIQCVLQRGAFTLGLGMRPIHETEKIPEPGHARVVPRCQVLLPVPPSRLKPTQQPQ